MLNLAELLKEAKTVGISGHIRPDGDCVGSCMAMYLYLTKNFPEKRVDVFLEEITDACRYIKDLDVVRTDYVTDVDSYDAFFVIDCDSSRIGNAKPYFDKAKTTINIDHHISNEGSCDINHLEPKASSAAEVVYGLMDEEKINQDIALAIYLGMIHDSGVFQYSNTSPKTLQIAAKMIGYGFDFSALIEQSFYQISYLQNKLLGKALSDSELLLDGRAIYSVITKETLNAYGAKTSDLSSVVSHLRNTKGVDCAIFMYELEENVYKISLRTSTKVNASYIAGLFGGGGHVKAAGFTMEGAVPSILEKLSKLIEEQLKLSQN